MRRFEDKVVLVTGAASGIGRATVERLAREGAKLLCVDVQAEALEAAAKAAAEPGAEAPTVVVNDLRKGPRCDRCWKRVVTAAVRADGATLCDRCAEAVGGRVV